MASDLPGLVLKKNGMVASCPYHNCTVEIKAQDTPGFESYTVDSGTVTFTFSESIETLEKGFRAFLGEFELWDCEAVSNELICQ